MIKKTRACGGFEWNYYCNPYIIIHSDTFPFWHGSETIKSSLQHPFPKGTYNNFIWHPIRTKRHSHMRAHHFTFWLIIFSVEWVEIMACCRGLYNNNLFIFVLFFKCWKWGVDNSQGRQFFESTQMGGDASGKGIPGQDSRRK